MPLLSWSVRLIASRRLYFKPVSNHSILQANVEKVPVIELNRQIERHPDANVELKECVLQYAIAVEDCKRSESRG